MESIYGDKLPELERVMERLSGEIEEKRRQIELRTGFDPVEHFLCRIKSDESMRAKCVRKGLPVNADSALNEIKDAIGVRIVCAFIDDVYAMRDALRTLDGCEVVGEKDYIKNVKPNGYRSYHMILRVDGAFFAEIQIRTISQDTWAALEHNVFYKKDVAGNRALITSELKRCADELASTDVSMQTIRDMISFTEGA